MPHISLTVKDPLTKRQIRQWLDFVKQYCPVTTLKKDDRDILIIRKKVKDGFQYNIPVMSHCGSDILDVMMDKWPLGVISASEPKEVISLGGWKIDETTYRGICQEIAKTRHQRYVDEKVKAGWRYAMDENPVEKTSRLLRPWDDLPERDKRVDETLPKLVMDIIIKWMDAHERSTET